MTTLACFDDALHTLRIIQAQIGFLFLVAVTTNTIRLEDGLNVAHEIYFGLRRQPEGMCASRVNKRKQGSCEQQQERDF